jgi:hypothetical protein
MLHTMVIGALTARTSADSKKADRSLTLRSGHPSVRSDGTYGCWNLSRLPVTSRKLTEKVLLGPETLAEGSPWEISRPVLPKRGSAKAESLFPFLSASFLSSVGARSSPTQGRLNEC